MKTEPSIENTITEQGASVAPRKASREEIRQQEERGESQEEREE